MNIFRISSEDTKNPENYDEMVDFFNKRTNNHIELVRKYCKKIEEYNNDKFSGLIESGKIHDQSKLENPEKEPYIWITWQYKCKDNGEKFEIPENIKEKMSKATEHHVKNNKHHPESHQEKEVNLINREDRDKPPKEMVDATKMTDLDIGEMVADWLAMSDEKKTNPNDWAKKNINIRWKFTKEQESLIYELIENIYK